MNDKFFELTKEKQKKIIDAALEVFATNEYKYAVTDDIAAKAGISKGLLFYYFHNKKELYTYLFQYMKEYLDEVIVNEEYHTITDFFEVLEYSSMFKYKIFQKEPNLLRFWEKVIVSADVEAVQDINKCFLEYTEHMYEYYFSNIDYSKFREGVDFKQIIQMLDWMTKGFMYEIQMSGKSIDMDELLKLFKEWEFYFKKIAYKEEYQESGE